MALMTIKAANAELTRLTNLTSEASLQNLFANLVYHALVHGNASLEKLALLRDSKAPAKFKSGLIKHLPVKWDKAAKQYNFDAEKANDLRLEYGIEYGESTFDDVVEVLPPLFAKVKADKKEFILADYLATVAKKLDKEGIANADDLVGLVSLLANNPDATRAAVHAAYSKTAGTVETNVA